jgi:hypothetical protein
MRSELRKLSVLVLAFFFCVVARAQDVASITGEVTDPTGAVIPNVTVTLQNTSTGNTYTGKTNGLGSYLIPNVPPGPNYKITFSATNFTTQAITGLYLNEDSTRTQNAVLAIGTSSATVQVSATSEAVTLNSTDATIGNNVEVQVLNELPVENRDSPSALFYEEPGVTLDGSVTGARTDQSNVTVDGLEVNDEATGEFGYIVAAAPVDSVQEFRGVVGDPLASGGQGGGGQFELVTKSGTNKFHGAAVEYHRDTDLEGNDWFNNNAGVPRPPLVRNQFGGDIGGPIKRDKAFFFFNYDGRRDARSILVDRTVPLGGNTSGSGCSGTQGYREGYVCYINSSGNTVTQTPAQVAALDPSGIGWDQTELKLFQSRYPVANDLTGDVGDLVNTAGYRFNAPNPYVENNLVGRVDYTINDKMRIWGRGTVSRINAIENPPQFPGDPTYEYPADDRSYAWVVGHNWTIGANKLNQILVGETYEDFDFDITYNPYGSNQYGFSGLSGPYGKGNNSQARTYGIPVVRDDFTWEKGRHSLSFGGQFKWESPNEFAAENYNLPSVGIAGNTNFVALSPNLRPSDIQATNEAANIWDSLYSTALGALADTSTNFNYNNKAVVQPTGSGLDLVYRYYETEVYFGDTWKVTPRLTISYGVRYENYTVPYETHGDEAFAQLIDNGAVTPFSFDAYWAARLNQSAQGNTSNTGVPFLQYVPGGKVNNTEGYYQPDNKMWAPRFAVAFSPDPGRKTVISAGGGIIYDHSIINALQFQQLQTSYLFEANNIDLYGTAGSPTASLSTTSPATGGTPRFGGLTTPPPLATAPNVTPPYLPYVVPGAGDYPYGLPYGEFNLLIDPKLKNPYNIEFSTQVQHEFPQGYLLKVNYMGRLGRRLLAEADASQLIEFPDNSGLSKQTMSQAFGALTTQLRQNADLGPLGAILAVTPQPWFEDVLTPGFGVANGFASNTQLVAYEEYPYPQRGDFADTMQGLSQIGFPFTQILPINAAMDSQFSSNTVWTNKGFSNYNGLLATLHKNAGYGLQFDLNYTWAHSIDNVSAIANFIASSSGYDFICDVARPRECRGNSDFDVANTLSGNFLYELPIGRGKALAATMPFWANEFVGGWELSGLPFWHTGYAYNAQANAFVASFANDAPATLIGSPGQMKTKINGGNGQPLFAYANPTNALNAYTGPTGFAIGSRNNLRGPGFFDLDLGLGKTFPIIENTLNLKFRCDAFNALNHPNFNPPSGSGDDITEAEGVQFGTIQSTTAPPGSDISARVLQGSLRLEF